MVWVKKDKEASLCFYPLQEGHDLASVAVFPVLFCHYSDPLSGLDFLVIQTTPSSHIVQIAEGLLSSKDAMVP